MPRVHRTETFEQGTGVRLDVQETRYTPEEEDQEDQEEEMSAIRDRAIAALRIWDTLTPPEKDVVLKATVRLLLYKDDSLPFGL